jgi:hypothetical protein
MQCTHSSVVWSGLWNSFRKFYTGTSPKTSKDQPFNFSCIRPQNFCLWSIHVQFFFYTVRTATFINTGILSVIRQWIVVISYRRFGTTYWSILQGSRIQKERRQPCYESKKKAVNPSTGCILWFPAFILDYWPLKKVPDRLPRNVGKK